MKNNVVNMERIIAKIDNDFNPDNSDWIPRVISWTIDALSILNCFEEQTNTKRIEVKDRIAYDKCAFSNIESIVDNNGCTIVELDETNCQSCESSSPFTGATKQSGISESTGTIGIDTEQGKGRATSISVETTKGSELPSYFVRDITVYNPTVARNYTIIDCDKIELNFDTDYIIVKSKGIKTVESPLFGCDVPVVPNNGLLIECIVAWCMYKMLCRGSKHPIFNLRDNSPATNPFVFWMQNKDKAKDSVIINAQGADDGNLWRSAFYIDTFDPKR